MQVGLGDPGAWSHMLHKANGSHTRHNTWQETEASSTRCCSIAAFPVFFGNPESRGPKSETKNQEENHLARHADTARSPAGASGAHISLQHEHCAATKLSFARPQAVISTYNTGIYHARLLQYNGSQNEHPISKEQFTSTIAIRDLILPVLHIQLLSGLRSPSP